MKKQKPYFTFFFFYFYVFLFYFNFFLYSIAHFWLLFRHWWSPGAVHFCSYWFTFSWCSKSFNRGCVDTGIQRYFLLINKHGNNFGIRRERMRKFTFLKNDKGSCFFSIRWGLVEGTRYTLGKTHATFLRFLIFLMGKRYSVKNS